MANLNPERIRQHLQDFQFTPLFVEELGWEKPRAVRIAADGARAREVAHLGGIPAIEVTAGAQIPDAKGRRAIYDSIAKQFHENLLLFVDEQKSQMLWYWVKREGGKSAVREHAFVHGQPGDLFLSKLAGLFVDLEEYDESGAFSVLSAGQKLKEALDVSKVTKKFYGNFKEVHGSLLNMLDGFPTEAEKRWYASVLLNRLMFVYFLQQKLFLNDGDKRYLEERFAAHQRGNIFRDFLQPLFFTAFALEDNDPKKAAGRAIFGKIPYLNGGLFVPHALEAYPITLKNEGADLILNLFKSVTWYLNDVPGADDNAMSPDVLGYIFEKYINDQKSAGAYYTPPEITEYLCERTIHDLLVERVSVLRNGKTHKFESVGDMLLDLDGDLCRTMLGVLNELRLCDPAVGSGAFLVAALKTLTNIHGALWGRAEVLNDAELKHQLVGDQLKHKSPFYPIRRRIITQNLYGVDIMPEATEIARLRLFLALVASARTVEELEPLPNIEFNILPGNSLIGMLHCEEKDFLSGGLIVKTQFDELAEKKDHYIRQYKQARHNNLGELMELKERANKLRGDLKELCDNAVLEEFRSLKISYEQALLNGKPLKKPLEIKHIRAQYPFHWGSEFDEVMENGGFDAIITNPPWEIWKPNGKEFFQQHSDVVTKKKMTIKQFEEHQKELLKDKEIAAAWNDYQSQFPHVSEYFRKSENYTNQISLVNGKKAGTDINLYKLFIERCFQLLNNGGRCGIVVPSGIYTDLGAKQLREMLFNEAQVSGLFCFENRREIFEGVHRSYKFVALSFRKGGTTKQFPAAFMRHDPSELESFPSRDSLHISVELVRRLSPDSLSVMEFKSERDVEIAEKMLRFPLLGQKLEDTWNLSLSTEFHMTNDSYLFETAPGKGKLPMYEGKMIHQFTHQLSKPRYWVSEKEGRANLLGRASDNAQKLSYENYRLSFRDIARNTDERTMIATIIGPGNFAGNTLPVAMPNLSNQQTLYIVAVLNSFTFDWLIRQKVTAHCNFFYVYSMPLPRLTERDKSFSPIGNRAARLICTTPEFDELAKAAGLRDYRDGTTEPGERARLRAELDGLVAHLYGLTEDEFAHILTTFPLVPDPVKLAARNAYRDIERGGLKVQL